MVAAAPPWLWATTVKGVDEQRGALVADLADEGGVGAACARVVEALGAAHPPGSAEVPGWPAGGREGINSAATP